MHFGRFGFIDMCVVYLDSIGVARDFVSMVFCFLRIVSNFRILKGSIFSGFKGLTRCGL